MRFDFTITSQDRKLTLNERKPNASMWDRNFDTKGALASKFLNGGGGPEIRKSIRCPVLPHDGVCY